MQRYFFQMLMSIGTVIISEAQNIPYGNNPTAGQYYPEHGIQKMYVESNMVAENHY